MSPTNVPPPEPRLPGARVTALLIAVVVGIGYSNSFRVPFQFDDKVVIVGDPVITEFRVTPASRRFLGDLSFALSYRAFGTSPAGYHAVNLSIHLANALLVLWLARLLLRTDAFRRIGASETGSRVAFLAPLLFAAHPLHTQAVTYIAQRYASLAAGLVLLAICCYARHRLSTDLRGKAAWYAGFLATSAAALWTKESAFVLPLLVLVIEVTFFSAPTRARLARFSPFLIAAAAAIVVSLASGVTLDRLDAATRVDTAMARSDYALTQLRVVASYLRLLAFPVGQNLDHDIRISHSLLEPGVLAAALLHALLLGGAALALVRGFRGDPDRRLAGAGIVWFYVALLVESSFVPIVDVMFEHRVYLPSVGLFLAAAVVIARAPFLARRRAWLAVTCVLSIALTGLTFARNRVWRDDLSLWSDAAAKSPGKARPLNNLGVALFERGDARQALTMYERAIGADPGYAKAYFNLAEALQRLGGCREAIEAYRFFLSRYPDYADAYRNLAECYELTGQVEAARWSRAMYERAALWTAGKPLPPALR